jgi:hypothetical protein
MIVYASENDIGGAGYEDRKGNVNFNYKSEHEKKNVRQSGTKESTSF